MDQYDIIVVGAGLYGLPMAKTYMEVHPTAQILVLDANKTVGGTWSSERLYPGLRTNNHVGLLEYPDFPMDFETFGVPKGSHCPGPVFHRYLTAYAQHYGVYEKIRFQALVTCAELRKENDWIVSYDWKHIKEDGKEEIEQIQVVTKKLVLATGTTSEPCMPSIPGLDSFKGEVFHTKELSTHEKEMEAAKNIVVLGGSKSAADAVYLNASQGRHVDWVIRESGVGPAWLGEIYVSPAKISFEKLTTTRIMTFLSPTIDIDAYPRTRYFLHNTRLGRALVRGFFSIINADMVTQARYHDHPETKKLLPKTRVELYGTKVGVLNYPTSFFDLIRQGLVHVHNADITSLSPHSVHLSNDEEISADTLICATGYNHQPLGGFKFLPKDIASKTGLSISSPTSPSVQAADAEIFRRFPSLKPQISASNSHQKEDNNNKKEKAPSWHLHRAIVPPSFLPTHNLAYTGMAPGFRGFLVAQMQALWITAFLDDNLFTASNPLPDPVKAEWETLLLNRFWRWKAPLGLGWKGPDMVFETLPYIDTLLQDLGLETRRKKGWGAWWKAVFKWYGVSDYEGIVGEWMRKEKEKRE